MNNTTTETNTSSVSSEKLLKEKERWEKLLSCRRQKELKSGKAASIECADDKDPRNPFQRDCDRITYSYPFRRMQNKTQVIPRPEIDFIHTRLTHSLEVATVGRSMGKLVEKFLENRNTLPDGYQSGSLSAVVAAACLAHDIGNPPFGHSGEDSISNYYRTGITFDNIIKDLSYNYSESLAIRNCTDLIELDSEDVSPLMDLMRFEGNAMGFKLLTKYNEIGLNLTSATLATFCKYPRQSYIPGDGFFDDSRWKEGASQKKYGFFMDDLEDFKLLADEVGLVRVSGTPENFYAWHRHPLAFLMEAADDICYRIIDLEDGFRLGLIPFQLFEDDLKAIASLDTPRYSESEYQSYRSKNDENNCFSYLRAKSINYLIHQSVQVFKDNIEGILSGEFDKELIKQVGCFETLNRLKTNAIKPKVYQSKEVLKIEAAGFEIIGKLLSEFTNASDLCLSCPAGIQDLKAKKFIQLLPDEFSLPDEDLYKRYLHIACYVAGMSDTYALDMYRKVTGMSIR